MKIIKLANQFEDEGKDSLESPERESFETQQELKNQEQKEMKMHHTADVLNQAMQSAGESILSSYVANGSVGWIRHSDGIIYEIIVSPANKGQYLNILKERHYKIINTI